MSKIARYAGNLRAFGSNAQGLERTLFGETTQADDLTSQVTTAFLRGWGIVGPSENPSLEDFNAAMYTMSQFIAYQHQMGVPEWDAAQEYYVGSLCVRAGETYSSIASSNIGSAPPSAKWTQVITVKNGNASLGLGTAATKNVGVGANQIPDMNSFASSLVAGGGYQKLPGGLIIQWGNGLFTNQTTTTVTLPIAFPNAGFTAVACKGASITLSGEYGVGAQIKSNSTMDISNSGGTTGANKGIWWIALGY